MAQTGLRSTQSRSRLGSRNGGLLPQSRSGERLHHSQPESSSMYGQYNGGENNNMLRNKVSKTHMSSNASTSASNKVSDGKFVATERRRPALSDKTNTQGIARNNNEFNANKGADNQTLKHKSSTANNAVNLVSGARREARPLSATIVSSSKKLQAGDATAAASSSSSSTGYAGARHLRGVSSSSGLSLSRQNSGQHLGAEQSSRSGSSLASGTSSQATLTGSRRSSAVRQGDVGVALAERQQLVRPQPQYAEAVSATRSLQPSPETSADEDMSEAESDWQSSSNDGRVSSKTETEDEAVTYKGPDSPIASSDEELIDEDEEDLDGEEEDDVSDSDSLLLNSLDPDCLVSLPAEIDELAREKMAQISALYFENVVRPAMLRQAAERQEAVARGEISADVAAHDDELALMGLDPDEVRDTSMVAEYSTEIFEYMSRCECRTMANPNYMDFQGEIRWHMRATLVDWLMQVHMRYHMMPETLWIAINIVDRFLSARVVSLAKLQLVGVTAMFIAAKYEEILAPSVDEFVFMTESGYTREEILKGERIILSTLDFNISGYCSPYSWVRRISKADDYDIQTRTLAKFLMELTLFDHRFLRAKPSLIAAVAMYLSKKMLNGTWNEAFVYYSKLVEEQLAPAANLLLERLVDDSFLDCFVCKKYGNRRFLKASHFAREWALRNQEQMLVTSASASSNISAMATGMSNVAFGESTPMASAGLLAQPNASAPAAVY